MAAEKDDDVTSVATLQDAGMYLLMGEIDVDTVRPAIEWILHANHVVKRKKKELTLTICSQGGDVGVAFALIDVMMSSAIPIKQLALDKLPVQVY